MKRIGFLFVFSCACLFLISHIVFQEYKTEQSDPPLSIQSEDLIVLPEVNDPPKPPPKKEKKKKWTLENTEPLNVLLIGIDARNDEPSRTDTIMVAKYNPCNKTAKIASIMRDSYVTIPGHSKNKINAAFAFGGEPLLQQTIEKNLDIAIDYYAIINFEGFINMIDSVVPDGLEVPIEKAMVDPHNSIRFQSGTQRLNGEEVLKYVRFRKDAESDFGRVRRQQQVLTLLKDEVLSFSGLTKIPSIIGAIRPHVETNIPPTKFLSIGRDLVFQKIDEIDTMTIPINNGFENKNYQHAGAVLELDLAKNKSELRKFLNE
ncbi:LCP family protein [Bacillus suaedae]|uniref:Regulatory protein MsrR n=1 Tax=Halalkalibacter suaedae TaxID=2822140 RepID=A0A941ALM3_9BACI|nr:LCP family protein [Bacillus suaedae]MBP3949555.1 LCP family protein [Bacillus suaedae]